MDNEDYKSMLKEENRIKELFRPDRDKYNTTETPEVSEDYYKRIIHSDIRIAPKEGQLLSDYVKELKIYAKIASDKNILIHIIKGVRGKPWYTHTRGDGCFMCEDTNFISITIRALEALSIKYPKAIF